MDACSLPFLGASKLTLVDGHRFEGSADVYADADDIAYLLEATESYFPEIIEDDAIDVGERSTFVADAETRGESSVSREHVLVVGKAVY